MRRLFMVARGALKGKRSPAPELSKELFIPPIFQIKGKKHCIYRYFFLF
jgi:hypothetical protein